MAKGSSNRFKDVVFSEQASAPVPDPVLVNGEWMLYVKTDDKLYKRDHTGSEAEVGAGASSSATKIYMSQNFR